MHVAVLRLRMHASTTLRSILLVDDVREIADQVVAVLKRTREFDVRFTTETSGARALDLARATPFDLVISDYNLGASNGIEILSAARARNPDGLRVLMTSYNEIPSELARIREASIDAYVQKPLKGHDLLLLLLGLLRRDEDLLAATRRASREIERAGD
jgi:two-component system response regulator HydG